MDTIVIENKTIDPPLVMCIDDDKTQLSIYSKFLSGKGFNLDLESDPLEALDKLKRTEPDLILLDISMPHMGGFEFMEAVSKMGKREAIPVIMISGFCSEENILRAYKSGAIDFIRKPFIRDEMVTRIRLQIENILMKKINSVRFENLESFLKEQLDEIKNIKNATIFSLAKIAESRDPETGSHLERIREYVKVLAMEMGEKSTYSEWVNKEFIYNIYNMSVLHDIGKVGIPDCILLKPGKLTEQEYAVMKTHTIIGGKALEATARLNRNSAFLEMGKEIALHHHEKWDGTGYPDGLKEEEIPLAARITTLADVYDAVSFKRVYRDFAMKEEDIDEMMKQECGKLFDPEIYRVYREIKDKFLAIKRIFS